MSHTAYLQVRNSNGELVGLMRGPFPESWIRRGVKSFMVVEGNPASLYDEVRARWHDLTVRQWWQESKGIRTIFDYLESDLPLDELKRIQRFR